MFKKEILRTGVYGVAKKGDKILLVVQKSGPFINLFDLPGGAVEFKEGIEEALHREFIEETGMDFSKMDWFGNFSAITETEHLIFHQIGLVYHVSELKTVSQGQLQHEWVNIASLKKEQLSPLASLTIFSQIHLHFRK